MDLSQFATQDNANEGVWTPVILYGKPADFDLLILGDDSDTVQQHGRKALKKLKGVMNKSGNEFDDETVDELTDNNDEAVIVRIAGIRGWNIERKSGKELSRKPEPVSLGDVVLTNDALSYRLLIHKIPALKEFILKTARDRTNFLSGPSGN